MQIHDLNIKETSKSKTKKRVGRGGKRGTYSGRGNKGQAARAGHRIRPAERDLIQRLPKLRGIKNRRKSPNDVVLNLTRIEELGLKSINRQVLLDNKILKPSSRAGIKVLGVGEITRAIEIAKGVKLSKTAEEKILKAKGTINK